MTSSTTSEGPILASDVEPVALPKPTPPWWRQPKFNGNSPHVEIVRLTPAMATELLAHNDRNVGHRRRPPRPGEEVAARRWPRTGRGAPRPARVRLGGRAGQTFDEFPRLEDDREHAQPCGRGPQRRGVHDRGEEDEGGGNPDQMRVLPRGRSGSCGELPCWRTTKYTSRCPRL
jgi:hypothetical protein